MTNKVWPVYFAATLLLNGAALIACAEDRTILAEIDIASGGDMVLLPVESDGNSHRYLLDTGMSLSAVPLNVAAKWKPVRNIRNYTAAGVSEVPVYERPNAESVMGLMLRRKTELIAMDFQDISEAIGQPIEGILGMSDLKRFVVQIDFDQGKLRFLRFVGDEAGEKLRLSFHRGSPVLDWASGETQLTIGIDTGANGELSLASEHFDALVKRGEIRNVVQQQGVTVTPAGTVKSSRGTLREFQFGGVRHQNVDVIQTQLNTVGVGLLSRYLVTFDFPKEAMYLKPGKRIKSPTPRDSLGMTILLRDNKVIVQSVRYRGPAEAASIQQGDVLTQINGENVAERSLFEIRRLFCQEGKTLKLRLERDNKSRDLTITLPKSD